MKKFTIATVIATFLTINISAQVVTTDPTPLLQDAENVVIYYHADQGNKGLINQPADQPIYAHTGVITSTSTSDADWKYAPTWGNNAEKYRLEFVSENLWRLNIGNINAYYGIPDGETVKRLAFVFRNASSSKEGKSANNGDIFVDVFQEGLHLTLTSSVASPILLQPTSVSFSVATTLAADISLKVNDTEIGSVENAKELKAEYQFSDNGSYTISATASSGDESATVEEVYTLLSASQAAEYPGGTPKMGAVRDSDGNVTFCIAAPGKNSAVIVGSWDNYDVLDSNTMKYHDFEGNRFFWITIAGLNNSDMYPYYYLVDGNYRVADPYARLILDPANDKYIPEEVFPNLPEYPSDKLDNVPLAVYQENINEYEWKVKDFKPAEKDNLIIYELLIRDFTGTEGKADANGTVKKAMAKLDYLQHLGVNAIELLPINEFNGNVSWGYNPNFYFAPDKAYGTPDDYKDFIDECHRRGMAVFLDIVFNQTDWLHPWYQLYQPGENPFYNADAPHAYSVLNDWNQGNPLVQQQFRDALQYWLTEYNVDGFRFDLVKGLGDNDSYANASDAATNAYNASRVARMKELYDAMLQVNPNSICINENLAGEKEENEMAADGEINWANVNWQSAQYAMGNQSDSSLARFYAPDDRRDWGSTVSYMESHDEQRLAYLQSTSGVTGIKGNIPNSMKRLGSVAAQMILAPGSHMLWQFQELGNQENTKTNEGNNTNPKVVPWSLLDNEVRRGLYESYSELIAIRTRNPELFSRQASFSSMVQANNWEQGRTLYSAIEEKELLTVINPNVNPNNPVTVTVSLRSKNNSDYQILSKSYGTEPSLNAPAGTVTVPANSYVVIGSLNVTGVDDSLAEPVNAPAFSVAEGAIDIYGTHNVVVFAVDGKKMYQGSQSRINLPTGLYLLRIDNMVVKIFVP